MARRSVVSSVMEILYEFLFEAIFTHNFSLSRLRDIFYQAVGHVLGYYLTPLLCGIIWLSVRETSRLTYRIMRYIYPETLEKSWARFMNSDCTDLSALDATYNGFIARVRLNESRPDVLIAYCIVLRHQVYYIDGSDSHDDASMATSRLFVALHILNNILLTDNVFQVAALTELGNWTYLLISTVRNLSNDYGSISEVINNGIELISRLRDQHQTTCGLTSAQLQLVLAQLLIHRACGGSDVDDALRSLIIMEGLRSNGFRGLSFAQRASLEPHLTHLIVLLRIAKSSKNLYFLHRAHKLYHNLARRGIRQYVLPAEQVVIHSWVYELCVDFYQHRLTRSAKRAAIECGKDLLQYQAEHTDLRHYILVSISACFKDEVYGEDREEDIASIDVITRSLRMIAGRLEGWEFGVIAEMSLLSLERARLTGRSKPHFDEEITTETRQINVRISNFGGQAHFEFDRSNGIYNAFLVTPPARSIHEQQLLMLYQLKANICMRAFEITRRPTLRYLVSTTLGQADLIESSAASWWSTAETELQIMDEIFQLDAQEDGMVKAIDVAERLLGMLPNGHVSIPRVQVRLARLLRDRWTRGGRPEDREASRQLLHTLVYTESSSVGHPFTCLALLRECLSWSEISDEGDESDLGAADHLIEYVKRAPWAHGSILARFEPLFISVQVKAMELESGGLSTERLRGVLARVDAAYKDDPDLSQQDLQDRDFFLARCQHDLWRLSCTTPPSALVGQMSRSWKPMGEMAAEEAFETLKMIICHLETRPQSRVMACRLATEMLCAKGLTETAHLISSIGVRALAELHNPFLSRSDHQHLLSVGGNLAVTAATLALDIHQHPAIVLEQLEEGRGVMGSISMVARAVFPPKGLERGSLVERKIQRLQWLAELLEHQDDANISGAPAPPFTMASVRRKRPAAAWRVDFDLTLRDIRKLPGMERYLLGMGGDEMMQLARNVGPIVVLVSGFTSHWDRLDAILVTSDGFEQVRLEFAGRAKLSALSAKLEAVMKATSRRLERANSALRVLLRSLWDIIVGPIVRALKTKLSSTGSTNPNYPIKINWIRTGLTGTFPLHAAGYEDGDRDAPLRIISSYSPSIKALQYAWEKSRYQATATRSTDTTGLLFIGMQHTSAKSDLPSVLTERETMGNIVAKALMDPDRREVLGEFKNHGIVHFAGHGLSKPNPSHSALLLSDWRSHPLTVEDLSNLNTKGARMFFLSGCHTYASSSHVGHNEESINLASSILLAGYPTVMATMWSISDALTPHLVRNFYEGLRLRGTQIDTTPACVSMHNAVLELRKRLRESTGDTTGNSYPILWAPYVHMGV